jgi:hypothetical protein
MKLSLISKRDLGLIESEIDIVEPTDLARVALANRWAPGVFNGDRRLATSLRSIELLALDIDENCTLDTALELFEEYKHVIMTTKSHQIEKNGVVCDRFRVVLWLNSPIDNDKDYKATWAAAQQRWGFIDPACKDASRFFYNSKDVVSIQNEGIMFKVVKAPIEAPRTVVAVANGDAKGDLWKSTLDFLLNGAPSGTRHSRLVSAVGNMKEQNYGLDEITQKIGDMTLNVGDWTQPGLSPKDLHTITDVFSRPNKYDFKPKEEDARSAASGVVDSFVSASDLLEESFEYLSDKDKVKGEPTGIEGLDRLLGGGFRTGELTVLMAQAKTGKNTFYHYLIYSYLKRGVPFGYASRELSPATEVLPNFLSIDTGTNIWKAEITEPFRKMAKDTVAKWPLYFAPGYGYFALDEMKRWFTEMKAQGVDHFLLDHLHYSLMSEDYESTTSLIKNLKSLTKELDIHLNLIVQPRSLRDGERLSLATLRGGAAIGQALDNLLILERVRGQDNISKLSLEVARHKLCKLGDIYLQYDSESTRFQEVEKALIVAEPNPQEQYGSYSQRRGGFKPYRVDEQ